MASRTGFFDRDNGNWLVSATSSGAINDDSKNPFIKYREQLTFNLEVKSVSGDTVSDYTGWATGGPYSFAFAIDNDWTHLDSGTLTAGLTGAITTITADGFTLTPDEYGGDLILRNAAGEQETVSYTSYTVLGTVYTFTVSATLTYTYALDDVCAYVESVLVAVENANITQTDIATAKLAIEMDGNTTAMLAAVQGSSRANNVRFELQVYDGSANMVDTVSGEWQALNILWDDLSIPPSAPASSYYTKTQSDARYIQVPPNYSEIGGALADADEIVLTDASDAGNIKRSLLSRLKTYIGAITGTLTNANRVTSVSAAGVIKESQLLDSVTGDVLTIDGTLTAARTLTMPDAAVDLADVNSAIQGTLTNANRVTSVSAAGVIKESQLLDSVAGDVLTIDGTLTAARTLTMPDADVDLADVGLETLIVALGDEVTALTTGLAKVTFRVPYACTLTAVRASVATAPTGSVLTVDINEAGVSVLSTKLTIDATEKTSTTAAAPPVISDSSLADDAELTLDIDTVGSTVAGAGLKVALYVQRV